LKNPELGQDSSGAAALIDANLRADLFELPFDQFQRYKAVRDFADFIREPGTPLKVLDVGGYPGLIVDFIPDDDVTVVDMVDAEFPGYIRADGARLPFEDASFDLVCTCDTLEHVPESDRSSFIAELARVSRDCILMTAPFFDPRTRLAEEILYNYVFKVLRADFVTLREHLDNGLPDFDQTVEWFKDIGVETAYWHSGYLYNWLPMMLAKHHLQAYPDTAQLHRRVDLFYNLNFSPGDNRAPSYRRVIVGSKGGARRLEDFCRQYQAGEEEAQPPDFSKLEMFRLLSELLNVDLSRNVGELVDRLKNSADAELVAAKAALVERDNRISDLQKIIKAQNDSLDELYALVSRIRNLWPYRVYKSLFKRGGA
jgi:hypothetical protein